MGDEEGDALLPLTRRRKVAAHPATRTSSSMPMFVAGRPHHAQNMSLKDACALRGRGRP